ncbi:hypothetical protein IWW37_003795 [Coemansia sp. RSA 2050]|nr:hypothetical protein IWW37_003795 [Coemansia sp. RSA 2050]
MLPKDPDLARKQSHARAGAPHKRRLSMPLFACDASAALNQTLCKGKSTMGRLFYAELVPPPVPTRPLPPPPPPLLSDNSIDQHYAGTSEAVTLRPENKLLRMFRRNGAAKKGSSTSYADVERNSSRSSHWQSQSTTESGIYGSISSRSIGGWDDTSSDRSTTSGATLVGSTAAYSTSSYCTAYRYGAYPAIERPSREGSVDLESQSIAERWPSSRLTYSGSSASQGDYGAWYGHCVQTHGCIPERSVSVGYSDRENGGNAGVLRFILRPHAIYAGILEVIDCDDMSVAYRKISRNGRAWCETFHEVPGQAAALNCGTAESAFVGSVDCKRAAVQPTPTQSASSTMTSTSTLLSMCGSLDHSHQKQECWWLAAEIQSKHRHPQAFELNQLWEMSSPCPTSFPLHCRDARGAIDPVPMTALVLDRYRFCYRFHLAGNKMKWMARPASAHTIELQCFVRSTLIALLQLGNSLGPDRRGQLQRQRQPLGKGKYALAADSATETGERLPVVTLFPPAFRKLAPVDADIIESFVLFTGIEVLECLFYKAT